MTIIPLGPALLAGSSDLPGGFGRAVLKRLPIWPCSMRGFACHLPYRDAVRSYRTFSPLPFDSPPFGRRAQGGIFSVPLSFELPRPGVTRRIALWSSDFPPSAFALDACARSSYGETAIIWSAAAER